jgi:hypothetical protein
MTLEELAATGLRGKALSDAVYADTLGVPPTQPSAERTPAERRASLENFFDLMHSLSDEELADNPLATRPLNVSILEANLDEAHAA